MVTSYGFNGDMGRNIMDDENIYRSLLKEHFEMHGVSFQKVYIRRSPEHYFVWLFEMGLLETRDVKRNG